MNGLRSLLGEVPYAFREALPWRWARALVLASVFLFEAGIGTVLFLHAPPPNHSLASNVLAGYLGFNLLLATGAAGAALARLLARPERLSLFRLAPLGETAALAHLLAPAVFAALAPVSLIGLPFALFAARSAPKLALGLIVAGMTAFAWAVLVATAAAGWLGQRFGRARGGQVLRSLSFLIGFAAILGFRRVSLPGEAAMPLLVLAMATPVVLPPLVGRASRSLMATLSGAEIPTRSKEPAWGSPAFGRILARSLSLPALVAAVPSLAFLLSKPALHPALASLLVVQLAAAPLDRLLEPEMQQPDRLRLAPEGRAFRIWLIVRCGGAACAIALALGLAIALPGNRWSWFAAVGAAVVIVPFTFFITSRRILVASQLILLSGALVATALWNL